MDDSLFKDREKEGHLFRYSPTAGGILGPGWESTGKGNRVVVLPPSESRATGKEAWLVAVSHQEATYEIIGEEAEQRAFAVACTFIRQQTY